MSLPTLHLPWSGGYEMLQMPGVQGFYHSAWPLQQQERGGIGSQARSSLTGSGIKGKHSQHASCTPCKTAAVICCWRQAMLRTNAQRTALMAMTCCCTCFPGSKQLVCLNV